MDKISVIVPIYNTEEYLDRVISSLINQTYKNIEIILIDDGSTDNSGIMCDKYSEKDGRIKVIHQKNKGVSEARNKGLKVASGTYIGFVDSDDYIKCDMYEILYNNLKETESDISACGYFVFKDDLPKFDDKSRIKIYSKDDALKDIITDGALTNFLWNKLFKKEIFKNIKFPKGKIYEDMYVMPKIICNTYKICFDSKKMYGYYKRMDSHVNSFTKEKCENYLDFSNECFNYLSKHKSVEKYLKNYRCFYIYSAFLQASKSRCKKIINSKFMDKYYDIYRNDFKYLNKKVSLKRKILFYVLYINKNLFYRIVTLVS